MKTYLVAAKNVNMECTKFTRAKAESHQLSAQLLPNLYKPLFVVTANCWNTNGNVQFVYRSLDLARKQSALHD